MDDLDLGPAPLDRYLKYPEMEGSPYPKLVHHSKKRKKMFDNIDNLLEAKNLLRHLVVTRETLEMNIDQVVRSHRDVHMFSALLGSGSDSPASDQLRIEKLVTKNICALEGDVQREVLRSLAQAEAEKLVAEQKLQLAVKSKLDQARRGDLTGQAERSARLAYSKPNGLATASAFASKGKENRESRVKPPPKTVAIKDEATRVRTYGKPEHQRGRTTIRDPYLHFKNPKKGVAAKSSVTNLNESARSRDGRSRSPPSRQGREPVIDHMPRQFYFSPTRGYIPLGAGDTAPVSGQLVSMAIPLGAPRLEPGVRRSAFPVTKCASDPVSSTPVTAARNVAMVSFPVGHRHGDYERQPEITKQVLPPIDIDSISSSSSQRSDIHIRSPQHDNANVTFLYDTQNEEDSDLNKTLTEEGSDLEQSGEGIKLPGYDPKTVEYSGPNFPPRTSKPGPDWTAGVGEVMSTQHVSNVMAEDLRRRDLLENNTVMWLEQELMARILSQVPLHVPEQATAADASKAESEQGSDWNESLLGTTQTIADVIGQGGMQLFIDAGQPVDNILVQELVKEVIKEKVMSLMSQRVVEGELQDRQTSARSEVEEVIEEQEREKIIAGSYRVPTPEPTPKTSPIPSPKRTRQHQPQPITPPQSPPTGGFIFRHIEPEPPVLLEPVRQPQAAAQPPLVITMAESESETSLSLDISEELRRVAAKDLPSGLDEQAVVCHDVTTPPLSPSLVAKEEKSLVISERQATPLATPPLTKTLPRVRTPSPKRKESVSDEEKEEVQEDIMEQPQPIMISVGVGKDRPMTAESQIQHRSPSPKRPLTPVSSTSEESSTSVESSTTETANEFISEGQWLLSYSEGQMVGAVNYEAIRKEIVGKGYQHIIDVSTASTLRDTDDLDLDAEGTKSEGEFMYGGIPDPNKDPRLEVLAQLQKRPIHVQQILSGPIPRMVVSSTGRSIGEMSIGQVAPSKGGTDRTRSYGEHGQERESHSATIGRSLGEDYGHKKERQERKRGNERPQHSRTPSPQQQQRSRTTQQHDQRSRTPSPQQQQRSRTTQQHDHRSRTPSPQQQQRSRTTQQHDQRSRTPSPQQQQRSRTTQQRDQRSRTPPQQERNRTKQQLDQRSRVPQQQHQGTRLRGQMQYQPVLSDGRPAATRGRTLPGQNDRHRNSDSRLSQNSDPGVKRSDSTYHSQSLSRSADGETFGQPGNGFLTSSLKSRQSGVKKSVEFDLSGTHQSSQRGYIDSPDHGADPNNSAGLTYTEASLDESELRRMGGGTGSSVGPYRMSVTIPSAADGEESELSEIDLSNKSDL